MWDGVGATFFYLCVYAAATLGTFAVLAYLGRQRQQIETVEELAGLGRTRPVMAAALAVCMFSLAGLPPAAGLWGKLMLFGSALNVQDRPSGLRLRPWFIGLAVIGVLNAAVAAYYYLRIVSLMYFREPLATPRAEGGPGACVAALLCSLAVLVLGFYPGPLMKGCVEAGGKVPVAEKTMEHNPYESPRTQGDVSRVSRGNVHTIFVVPLYLLIALRNSIGCNKEHASRAGSRRLEF